jgi:hypothetical protein
MCRAPYKGHERGPPLLRLVRSLKRYVEQEIVPKVAVVACGWVLDQSIKRLLPQIYVSTSVNMNMNMSNSVSIRQSARRDVPAANRTLPDVLGSG